MWYAIYKYLLVDSVNKSYNYQRHKANTLKLVTINQITSVPLYTYFVHI